MAESVYNSLAKALGYYSFDSMLQLFKPEPYDSGTSEEELREIHEELADDPILQHDELETLEAALKKLQQPRPDLSEAVKILESAVKVESDGYFIGYALTVSQVAKLLMILRPYTED